MQSQSSSHIGFVEAMVIDVSDLSRSVEFWGTLTVAPGTGLARPPSRCSRSPIETEAESVEANDGAEAERADGITATPSASVSDAGTGG